jgi:hypothetical protein
LPQVTYNVVLVQEVGGPGDGTDVSWLLVTTLPIDTNERILAVLQYYLARWTIEVSQAECVSSAGLYRLAA